MSYAEEYLTREELQDPGSGQQLRLASEIAKKIRSGK